MEKSAAPNALKEELAAIFLEVYHASGENKKPVRGSPVSEVREITHRDERNVLQTAYVVFVSYNFLRENRELISKLTNAVTLKKERPCFVVAQRTIIHPKSKYNQKIPHNRTLTSVYESLLEDLIFPGQVIGKRIRFAAGGKQLIKYHLNADAESFVRPRAELIRQAYHDLTGRTVALEFRAEPNYAVISRGRRAVAASRARRAAPAQ